MKLPKNSYPGVYKIPCSCGMTPYRGETKKKISTRIKEHQEYIRKNQPKKSGIALHASTCDGEVLFDEASTEAVQPNKFLRKVREALEIQKHDCHTSYGGMNPDKGQYVTTKYWIPLMKFLKKSAMWRQIEMTSIKTNAGESTGKNRRSIFQAHFNRISRRSNGVNTVVQRTHWKFAKK